MTKLLTGPRLGHLATLGAGIAIGLAVIGRSAAAPAAPALAPAKTVTHHLALAASAFAPDSIGDAMHGYTNFWDPTTLSNTSGRCFNAGLQLPAGVTLKTVTFHYTAGDHTMLLQINRQNLITHTFKLANKFTMIAGTLAYTATTLRIPASLAVVDYGKYAYSAGVCPEGTTTFSGLIITYTQRV